MRVISPQLEAHFGSDMTTLATCWKIKRMATTQARRSWYELEDFASAKARGINRFTLMLERRTVAGQEQWWGTFEYGQKKLKVMATLERD